MLRPLHTLVDYRGAARLAMTQQVRHCRTALSSHPRHLIAPRPVISRSEAMLRPPDKAMDCHGAVRLAMTQQVRHCRTALSSRPCYLIAPLPCHYEERSNPSATG
jgi:hypothetical protein